MKSIAPLKFYLFLIALFATGLYSCYKCHKARHYGQQQETRKYLPRLNNGSYFVYRNTADTTDVDTLYVVQNSDTFAFHFAEKQCDGDYFERQNTALVFAKDRDTVTSTINSGTAEDDYAMHGSYKASTLFSYYSVDPAGNILTTTADALKKLPTYSIAGNTYNDVISVTTPVYTIGKQLVVYYAAGIGIIQYDTYDEENAVVTGTYQLVSYSIK